MGWAAAPARASLPVRERLGTVKPLDPPRRPGYLCGRRPQLGPCGPRPKLALCGPRPQYRAPAPRTLPAVPIAWVATGAAAGPTEWAAMTTTIDLPSHFNVAEHFLNLNLGGEREDHPYLICGDDRLTYRELYDVFVNARGPAS